MVDDQNVQRLPDAYSGFVYLGVAGGNAARINNRLIFQRRLSDVSSYYVPRFGQTVGARSVSHLSAGRWGPPARASICPPSQAPVFVPHSPSPVSFATYNNTITVQCNASTGIRSRAVCVTTLFHLFIHSFLHYSPNSNPKI